MAFYMFGTRSGLSGVCQPTAIFETDMMQTILKIYRRLSLLVNRIAFHVFFKRIPAQGEYCNSKLISVVKCPDGSQFVRDYLVFIRCGTEHQLIDDSTERCFDIALNVYAKTEGKALEDCEYLIAGGVNKYKAAGQFIDKHILARYKGFMFMDDDLEITSSRLARRMVFHWHNPA